MIPSRGALAEANLRRARQHKTTKGQGGTQMAILPPSSSKALASRHPRVMEKQGMLN